MEGNDNPAYDGSNHGSWSAQRRCHKWALCAHKGGKCVKCEERVTSSSIEKFHFDHRIGVNNAHDKSDRWGGAVRDWPPFTEKWILWADTVDLICESCHLDKHKTVNIQLDFSELQERLDKFDPGPPVIKQEMLL